jgi:hypothetical protein
MDRTEYVTAERHAPLNNLCPTFHKFVGKGISPKTGLFYLFLLSSSSTKNHRFIVVAKSLLLIANTFSQSDVAGINLNICSLPIGFESCLGSIGIAYLDNSCVPAISTFIAKSHRSCCDNQ